MLNSWMGGGTGYCPEGKLFLSRSGDLILTGRRTHIVPRQCLTSSADSISVVSDLESPVVVPKLTVRILQFFRKPKAFRAKVAKSPASIRSC